MRTIRFTLLMLVVSWAWLGSAAADIAVGFANPLSGPYALSGTRNRTAVEMAIRDLNQNGGVLHQEVTLAVADDACGLDQAVNAAQHLIASDVAMVVGHMCSHSSLMAAGLYEAADIPMITPSSTHPRLTEEGRKNVFRLIGRDDHQGRFAGDLLVRRWAGKKIAILHDGSTYGQGLAIETRRRLRALGETETMFGRYEPDQTDYGGVAAKLRHAAIEVLYVGGYGPEAAAILKTARSKGSDIQLIGGDGLGMDEFWSVAADAGEGAIFTGRPIVKDHPGRTELLARFRSYGLGTRAGGLGAYAAVQVWAQAVERAGTIEAGSVEAALHHGRFMTVLGRVAFDNKGDLKGADWQWKVWSDGNYLPLGSYPPTH